MTAPHQKAQRPPRLYTELDGGGSIGSDADCPSDTRGLLIGSDGDLSAVMKGGTVVSMPVLSGFLPGEFVTVLSAGSTVSDVWAAT